MEKRISVWNKKIKNFSPELLSFTADITNRLVSHNFLFCTEIVQPIYYLGITEKIHTIFHDRGLYWKNFQLEHRQSFYVIRRLLLLFMLLLFPITFLLFSQHQMQRKYLRPTNAKLAYCNWSYENSFVPISRMTYLNITFYFTDYATSNLNKD